MDIAEYSDYEAIQLLLACYGVDVELMKDGFIGFTDSYRLLVVDILVIFTGKSSRSNSGWVMQDIYIYI